jgi:hypothetical protein
MPKGTERADSLKYNKERYSDDRARGQQVLLEAQRYYDNMYQFRVDRERNKRYNYGDQWGDVVCVDGKKMTEEEYIKSQGSIPLKTNLIRKQVNTVIGLFLGQQNEPTCIARDRDEQSQAETMSTVLQYNMQLNRMTEVYANSMEEYLISGLIMHRKWNGWRDNKLDCWTDYVQPNNIILDNNMRDFRGWDCSFIGEIHDMSREEVLERFADSPEAFKRLEKIYDTAMTLGWNVYSWEQFGYGRGHANIDFLMPSDASRCRVIEVWRKESKPRYRCHDYNNGEIFKIDPEDLQSMVIDENNRRWVQAQQVGIPYEEVPFIKAEWFIDSYWYYYYLSPMGDILKEGETPYEHKSHPYVFKAYPFIDGEIHSFVNDIIDQQRYINRIYMLNDWIIRASAKGVLMVPEDCLKGRDPSEFTDNWAKFNGVIFYTPSKTGAVPQQISANSTNIGLHEFLSMQLKMMEDVSGVNSSLQGKAEYSGMSAAMFNMQTQNATTSLRRILDSFQGFVLDAAYKDVKNIQQFYDQKRTFNIAGKAGTQIVYDPAKIRDVEFDLSIVPSQASPVYRAITNEFLMKLFEMQAISVEQLLQAGDFPFADELLQSIQSQKEQVEQGQMPDGMSPELMGRVQQGLQQKSNPKAMGLLQQAMGYQMAA